MNKPAKTHRHGIVDGWNKKYPNGYQENWSTPVGETPICCPDSKDPTPRPVEQYDPRHTKGTRICNPKTGGCGSEWTPLK